MNIDAGLAAVGTAIVGVVTLVFVVLSKTLGGVTDTRRAWRGMRRESEDARIADMTQDLDYLRRRVDTLVADSEHVWRLIHDHRPWDHRMIELLRAHNPDALIQPPPPLLPRPSRPQDEKLSAVAADVRDTIDVLEAKAAETPE